MSKAFQELIFRTCIYLVILWTRKTWNYRHQGSGQELGMVIPAEAGLSSDDTLLCRLRLLFIGEPLHGQKDARASSRDKVVRELLSALMP